MEILSAMEDIQKEYINIFGIMAFHFTVHIHIQQEFINHLRYKNVKEIIQTRYINCLDIKHLKEATKISFYGLCLS
ncbi:hypothetical protein MXB_2210 [Myxobolus squamalis]|nr:hypothetical protein MXB_2210 [Myxobolus squamalis]